MKRINQKVTSSFQKEFTWNLEIPLRQILIDLKQFIFSPNSNSSTQGTNNNPQNQRGGIEIGIN